MKIKHVIILVLVMLCVTGCGDQAKKYHQYVKGNLDVIYHGEYSDYEMAMDANEAEAEGIHRQGIENYTNRFIALLGLTITTEEQKQKVASIVEQVCNCAKYDVSDAYREHGDYYVDVTVYPMDYEVVIVKRCRELLDEASRNLKSGIYRTEEECQKAYTIEAIAAMEQNAKKIAYSTEEKFSLMIKFNNSTFYIENDDFLEVSDYIFAAPIE